MSLYDDAFTTCTFQTKTRVPDGYGGYSTVWADGATFKAAITFDNSMQARTAEQAGVTSVYTVSTRKNLTLEYHDVFRRESDKKVFRVTSDGDDKFTPPSASIDMRQVSAEEFTLPN